MLLIKGEWYENLMRTLAGLCIWFQRSKGKGMTMKADDQYSVTSYPPNLTKRILLVDDDSLFRRALAEELEEHGFKIIQAGCGKEALEHMETHGGDFDLALFDFCLPDSDGLCLLSEARKYLGDCPIILITANDAHAVRQKAIESGAFQFLNKLDDFGHIIQTVKSAVHNEIHDVADVDFSEYSQ